MGQLPDDLVRPDHTLIETHISWVLLGEQTVWKLKKPVNFGFLDFRTAEQRRVACEAEVRLNRRLAADVYQKVVPVTVDDEGRFTLDGTGRPVDWAVQMRRLSDETRADVRLAQGALDLPEIDRIAVRLAEFHARAERAIQTDEEAQSTIARNVRENFSQTRHAICDFLSPEQARELEQWQLRFIEDHRDLLQARVNAGRIRDGHGDLRLEHIYLEEDGSITIIDCIEFNERFRLADVCCDLAFLAMDLGYQGRTDLAERLLAVYARESNDYELYRLVNFYESYRAHVRAKVSLLLASDPAVTPHVREQARERARRYFLLAVAEERKPLVPPALILVGGPIASGKSTVAHAVGTRLGAPVIESDRTRKFLEGVPIDQNLATGHFVGAYGPESTERVYQELLTRAEAVLGSGRSVVLDASFRQSAHRLAALRLAERLGLPFSFIECRAPRSELEQRLARRGAGEVSDARGDLLDAFLDRWEPVTELPPTSHLVVDTSMPLTMTLERLGTTLPFWPDARSPRETFP